MLIKESGKVFVLTDSKQIVGFSHQAAATYVCVDLQFAFRNRAYLASVLLNTEFEIFDSGLSYLSLNTSHLIYVSLCLPYIFFVSLELRQ